MRFSQIIDGLLKDKCYTYTNKSSEVHFFIAMASPINQEDICLSLIYFEDLEGPDDNDWDPEPLEVSREDLIHNSWREVRPEDFYNENDDIHD